MEIAAVELGSQDLTVREVDVSTQPFAYFMPRYQAAVGLFNCDKKSWKAFIIERF